jgi:hypothetical protein
VSPTAMRLISAVTLVVLAAEISAQTPPADDRFYRAIRQDDLAALRSLVRDEGINGKDAQGETPLTLAAAFGSPETLRFLIASGAYVPYVFDLVTADISQFEERDHTLPREMASAWVQFAKSGNPNGPGLPQWPKYRSPDYRFLDYGDETMVRSTARSAQVDLFRRALETMRQRASNPQASLK